MLNNTITKIPEILFAYIQEEVYVCREDSVNTNHYSIIMKRFNLCNIHCSNNKTHE